MEGGGGWLGGPGCRITLPLFGGGILGGGGIISPCGGGPLGGIGPP